jgi:type IV secretion system protein VirB6
MATLTLDGLVGAADGITNAYLNEIFPALASAVWAPIFFIAVLYWVSLGYKIFAGYEPIKWNDILKRIFMTVAIFASLSWSGLGQTIYGFFTSFMESAAATIMSGEPTVSMLDALFNNVGQVSALLQNVSWYQFGMILQGFGLLLINCLLFVLALVYLTIAKFGLAITMSLLPIFIGFFFFDQTRQWGLNWINKMLNFSFIYVLVIAIIRLGFLAFGEAIDEAGKAASASDAVMINVQQISYLFIIEGVLIIFMLQVKSWAAALSSGASVQGVSLLIAAGRMFTGGAGKK